jgi:hypothetical protein
MKKRRRVIAVLLACIILAACTVLLWPGEKEPQYKGRTLTHWMLINYRSTGAQTVRKSVYNPTVRQESEHAVRQIGTNALPWLIKWMQSVRSNSKWRLRAADILGRLPGRIWEFRLDAVLEDPAETRLRVAIEGFRILGTNASPAVPELIRLANNRGSPDPASVALTALTSVGEAGVHTLVAILSDPRDPRRPAVANIIRNASLGTNAEVAVRLLSVCVADPDTSTAVAAAESLGDLRIKPEVSVPALAEGLRDPRDRVREVCARSLSRLGELARSALPN